MLFRSKFKKICIAVQKNIVIFFIARFSNRKFIQYPYVLATAVAAILVMLGGFGAGLAGAAGTVLGGAGFVAVGLGGAAGTAFGGAGFGVAALAGALACVLAGDSRAGSAAAVAVFFSIVFSTCAAGFIPRQASSLPLCQSQ